MASVAVLIIMAGCAAFQFFKGTLVTAFTMVVSIVLGSFVAFGFHEPLAALLAKQVASLTLWAPVICFVLLLVIVFALLQAVVMQVFKGHIDLGTLPEQIGRPILGLILGFLVSGNVLVAAALAPLPNKYPYARFDERDPQPDRPEKVLLNPDGFSAGLFSIVSNGSFSAMRSGRGFGALRCDFVDQLYLNRHGIDLQVPLRTESVALDIAPKNAAWHAPDGLQDSEGRPLSAKSGHSLVVVRVGINRRSLRVSDGGVFTLSQVRLVCVPRNAKDPLYAKGRPVYPVGFLTSARQVQTKKLGEKIDISAGDPKGASKPVDFVFDVPTNHVPAFVEFKLNNVASISGVVSAEQAPPPAPSPVAPSAPEKGEGNKAPDAPAPTAPPTGPADETSQRPQGRPLSDLSRSFTGDLEEQ